MDIKDVIGNIELRNSLQPLDFVVINERFILGIAEGLVAPHEVTGNIVGIAVLLGHAQQYNGLCDKQVVGFTGLVPLVHIVIGLFQGHDLLGHNAVAVLSGNGQQPLPQVRPVFDGHLICGVCCMRDVTPANRLLNHRGHFKQVVPIFRQCFKCHEQKPPIFLFVYSIILPKEVCVRQAFFMRCSDVFSR